MHYNPLPHDKYSLFMNLNRSVHLCLAVTFTFKVQRSFVNCIFNCKYFSTTTLENWQLLLHSNKEKENDVNCGGADTRGQTQKDRPCMTVEGQTQGNRHMGTDTKGPSLYDMTPSLYDK